MRSYLCDLLDKKAFDKKGLIYGMGHAIYSVSDPRAEIFKKFVKQLAIEKGCEKEYALYETVDTWRRRLCRETQDLQRCKCKCRLLQWSCVRDAGSFRRHCINTNFAAARIVGWSAHRLEELKNADKIVRPAYKPLAPYRDYVRMKDR